MSSISTRAMFTIQHRLNFDIGYFDVGDSVRWDHSAKVKLVQDDDKLDCTDHLYVLKVYNWPKKAIKRD